MISLKLRLLLPIILPVMFASAVLAAPTEVTFSISGLDPVNVMRFQDPEKKSVRIGYIQSTDFAHTLAEDSGEGRKIEDGILYYSVIFERIEEDKYQMDISYDFAAPDGRSEGVRNRSLVNAEVLKNITHKQILERAEQHAAAFTDVVFDFFLKEELQEETRDSLKIFMTEIITDLLKSLPRDGVMIMRRWDDLAGKKGA